MIRILLVLPGQKKWCCLAIIHQPVSTRALEGIFEATHRLIYGARMTLVRGTWPGLDTVPVSEPARYGPRRSFNTGDHASWWLANVNIVMNYIRNLDSETGAMCACWKMAISH